MELSARAQRSDGWWAISVPDVRGLFSQSKRLDQAEAMISEAAALHFGIPESSIDVTVVPAFSEVHIEQLRTETDEARATPAVARSASPRPDAQP